MLRIAVSLFTSQLNPAHVGQDKINLHSAHPSGSQASWQFGEAAGEPDGVLGHAVGELPHYALAFPDRWRVVGLLQLVVEAVDHGGRFDEEGRARAKHRARCRAPPPRFGSHGQHVAIVAHGDVVVRQVRGHVVLVREALQALLQLGRDPGLVARARASGGRCAIRDLPVAVDATQDVVREFSTWLEGLAEAREARGLASRASLRKRARLGDRQRRQPATSSSSRGSSRAAAPGSVEQRLRCRRGVPSGGRCSASSSARASRGLGQAIRGRLQASARLRGREAAAGTRSP